MMTRATLGLGRRALLALSLVIACLSAFSQSVGNLYVRPVGSLYIPLDKYTDPTTGVTGNLYNVVGGGGGAALDLDVTSWLVPFVQMGYTGLPYNGSSSMLQGLEGDLGLGFVLRPFDRLGLRLDAMGGMTDISYYDSAAAKNASGLAFSARGMLGFEYRIIPSLAMTLSGGYATYFGTQAQIFSAIEVALSLKYDLQSMGGTKSKVKVVEPKLDAVFPSLYAYYDDNPFGTVKVVNGEDCGITDVKVSFNAGHYMDQPKVCGEYSHIARGASVVVPVKALFTDSVLLITQGTDAKGEIIVEYNLLGSPRVTRVPLDFRMHHRNAITWSDDRRAASFVSPTNPAALWFAKFASGVVRDRFRGDINRPLQYAIGMFEAERLYGLNYVVVPANDYSVKHGLKDYVDSVQFPHQTLSNRGGDCSDLAVLFTTLMQSVGVEAAFITIPGHIFAAFDTGLSEDDARLSFYDPGLLIYKDGKAWVPVEITMVKDGFIKAWRVAAKEWYDSNKKGTAAFYPLPDCWKIYPPAAFPAVNPRFTLPSDSDEAVAFDGALDRFVARQIQPAVQSLGDGLAKEAPAVRANELGVLYARYGMLKESWAQLSDSAKAGTQVAWTNLANVAYLRKDYKLALQYYQWSYSQNNADDNALLGMARCQYELEDFNSSDSAYALLESRNPALAGKFGYLASIYGGQGRAWSLADRASSTSWTTALAANSGVRVASVSTAAPPVSVIKDNASVSTAQVAQTAVVPSAPVGTQSTSVIRSAAVEDTKPAIAAEAPADEKIAGASAVELAAQKRQADLEAQVEAAKSEKKLDQPIAKPTVAAEAPKDQELAEKTALAADQKRQAEIAQKAAQEAAQEAAEEEAARQRQAELAAKVAASAAAAATSDKGSIGSSPPTVTTEAPKDQDIAEKAALAAQQKKVADEAAKEASAEAAAEAAAAAQKRAADLAVKTAAVATTVAPESVAPPRESVIPESTQAASTAPKVEQAVPKAESPAPKTEQAAPKAEIAKPANETAIAEAPPPQPMVVEIKPAETKTVEAKTVEAKPTETKAVGDSELPATLSGELLLSGFDSATSLVGSWSFTKDVATQTDPEAFFAKLGMPLVQEKRAFHYTFTAKSTAVGRGWVGVGFHAFTPASYTQKGYGGGDSLCVWLTRDPVHLKENITRLQLYRSTDDWNMDLIAEVPVNESIYDDNRFDFTVDPVAGTVSVSLNGSERLTAHDVLDLKKGIYVVVRALDTAEFRDFSVEVAK
jgi:hypothetical protein